jgi:hypothetical protein
MGGCELGQSPVGPCYVSFFVRRPFAAVVELTEPAKNTCENPVVAASGSSRMIAFNPAEPVHQVSQAKINELLRERHQRFTPLQRLLRQAANQESWTAQLQALLPDNLKRDCQVIEVAGPTIVVSVRTAASATKLRFIAPELVTRLADLSSFHGAKDIRIRVSAEKH